MSVETKPIDSTIHYDIFEPTWMCCGKSQFRYVCKAHGEEMGCYFCEFNYDEPCGHEGELPQSEMDALRIRLKEVAERMKTK